MKDTEAEDKSWSPWSPAWWLAVLLVMYVLSVGPADRLVGRGHISPSAVMTFYAPLIWLYDHTPLKRPLDWYTNLWR